MGAEGSELIDLRKLKYKTAMSIESRDDSSRQGLLPDTESRGSLAPLLPGSFPSSSGDPPDSETTTSTAEGDEISGETSNDSKRSFWNIGKKPEAEKPKASQSASSVPRASATGLAPVGIHRPSSPLGAHDGVRSSASPHRYLYGGPASPAAGLYSSSPRPHSPASSLIFERNVQDEVPPSQASPHIPSHITTEDHVPPALDASVQAITSDELDPDSVEVVTHSMHQPASFTVTGSNPEASQSQSFHAEHSHPAHRHDEDNASNYGSLDATDVRRLSFISFADVVHAEHAEHEAGVDPVHYSREGSVPHFLSSQALGGARSPSPIRSPLSSQALGTSPPTSVSTSGKAAEVSPNRGGGFMGSPGLPQSSPLGGELNIETMRQALRKTGSADLSGIRSQPMSAVGNEEGAFTDRPFK